jgi:hypothetical protein
VCITHLDLRYFKQQKHILHIVLLDFTNDSVTFDLGTWFVDATHHLDVVDICAKLFQNPSMYDKVTVRTRMCMM